MFFYEDFLFLQMSSVKYIDRTQNKERIFQKHITTTIGKSEDLLDPHFLMLYPGRRKYWILSHLLAHEENVK